MITLEFRLVGAQRQFTALDEAIRTTQFIRNKCVRLWQDTWGTTRADLSGYCRILAQEYPFVRKLNARARQAAAERAGAAITRFYQNCKHKKPGKKGYPRFQKDCRSVEYKTTGWTLDERRRHLTLTDSMGTCPRASVTPGGAPSGHGWSTWPESTAKWLWLSRRSTPPKSAPAVARSSGRRCPNASMCVHSVDWCWAVITMRA
jgi:hypothetical protein